MLQRAVLVRSLVLFTLAGSVFAASCGRNPKNKQEVIQTPSPTASPAPTTNPIQLTDPLVSPAKVEDMTYWADKVSVTVRGRHLSPEELATLSEDTDRVAFVDQMLSDTTFVDRLLQFNLYFLGFGREDVRDSKGNIDSDIFMWPAAVNATRQYMSSGDYFTLFDEKQPHFIEPGASPLPIEDITDPDALRSLMFDKIGVAIDQLVERGDAMEKEELCATIHFGENGIHTMLSVVGLPDTTSEFLRTSPLWFGGYEFYCFLEDFDRPEVASHFAGLKSQLGMLKDLAASVSSSEYQPQNLNEYRMEEGDRWRVNSLSENGFFQFMTNSSTNYNRRRAAYVLKRFFCDVLTPVQVAIPENHTSTGHASDAGCQTCHYKLDPMAGFFREYGIIGRPFAQYNEVLFDDFARMPKDLYFQNWSDAASGKLKVGYIRSLRDDQKNSYGSTLTDLFHIIRTSPESKRCVAKRLTEFVVGEQQTHSPLYLSFLSDSFVQEAEMLGSSPAVKRLWQRVLLSNAFATKDPNSNQCYDFAERGGPPCQVQSILNTYCVACHKPNNASGGLDLASWVPLTDGKFGFAHVRDGAVVDRVTTLTIMTNRLTETDITRQMPLNMEMPTADRETLFNWLIKQ